MITALRVSLTRFPSFSKAPRALSAVCTRSFAIETKSYASKEHVEEERFIRERERALLQKKFEDEMAELEKQHTAAGIKGDINKEAEYDAKITLYVKELETLLLSSGDKVSTTGLYNVAKWKLDGSVEK